MRVFRTSLTIYLISFGLVFGQSADPCPQDKTGTAGREALNELINTANKAGISCVEGETERNDPEQYCACFLDKAKSAKKELNKIKEYVGKRDVYQQVQDFQLDIFAKSAGGAEMSQFYKDRQKHETQELMKKSTAFRKLLTHIGKSAVEEFIKNAGDNKYASEGCSKEKMLASGLVNNFNSRGHGGALDYYTHHNSDVRKSQSSVDQLKKENLTPEQILEADSKSKKVFNELAKDLQNDRNFLANQHLFNLENAHTRNVEAFVKLCKNIKVNEKGEFDPIQDYKDKEEFEKDFKKPRTDLKNRQVFVNNSGFSSGLDKDQMEKYVKCVAAQEKGLLAQAQEQEQEQQSEPENQVGEVVEEDDEQNAEEVQDENRDVDGDKEKESNQQEALADAPEPGLWQRALKYGSEFLNKKSKAIPSTGAAAAEGINGANIGDEESAGGEESSKDEDIATSEQDGTGKADSDDNKLDTKEIADAGILAAGIQVFGNWANGTWGKDNKGMPDSKGDASAASMPAITQEQAKETVNHLIDSMIKFGDATGLKSVSTIGVGLKYVEDKTANKENVVRKVYDSISNMNRDAYDKHKKNCDDILKKNDVDVTYQDMKDNIGKYAKDLKEGQGGDHTLKYNGVNIYPCLAASKYESMNNFLAVEQVQQEFEAKVMNNLPENEEDYGVVINNGGGLLNNDSCPPDKPACVEINESEGTMTITDKNGDKQTVPYSYRITDQLGINEKIGEVRRENLKKERENNNNSNSNDLDNMYSGLWNQVTDERNWQRDPAMVPSRPEISSSRPVLPSNNGLLNRPPSGNVQPATKPITNNQPSNGNRPVINESAESIGNQLAGKVVAPSVPPSEEGPSTVGIVPSGRDLELKTDDPSNPIVSTDNEKVNKNTQGESVVTPNSNSEAPKNKVSQSRSPRLANSNGRERQEIVPSSGRTNSVKAARRSIDSQEMKTQIEQAARQQRADQKPRIDISSDRDVRDVVPKNAPIKENKAVDENIDQVIKVANLKLKDPKDLSDTDLETLLKAKRSKNPKVRDLAIKILNDYKQGKKKVTEQSAKKEEPEKTAAAPAVSRSFSSITSRAPAVARAPGSQVLARSANYRPPVASAPQRAPAIDESQNNEPSGASSGKSIPSNNIKGPNGNPTFVGSSDAGSSTDSGSLASGGEKISLFKKTISESKKELEKAASDVVLDEKGKKELKQSIVEKTFSKLGSEELEKMIEQKKEDADSEGFVAFDEAGVKCLPGKEELTALISNNDQEQADADIMAKNMDLDSKTKEVYAITVADKSGKNMIYECESLPEKKPVAALKDVVIEKGEQAAEKVPEEKREEFMALYADMITSYDLGIAAD